MLTHVLAALFVRKNRHAHDFSVIRGSAQIEGECLVDQRTRPDPRENNNHSWLRHRQTAKLFTGMDVPGNRLEHDRARDVCAAFAFQRLLEIFDGFFFHSQARCPSVLTTGNRVIEILLPFLFSRRDRDPTFSPITTA